MEIKYTKIHFNFDKYHFKLKFRWNPYPLVEDYICDLVKWDRDFAKMVCDTFFSWLQAMAEQKKDPFIVVVSEKREKNDNQIQRIVKQQDEEDEEIE